MIYKYVVSIPLIIIQFTISCSAPSKAQSANEDTLSYNQNQHANIAYGVQNEWKKSSSFTSIQGSELQKSAIINNLGNALHGRITGLAVMQNSAEPGIDSPVLFSRGIGTYGPGRNVLVMVDGFESTFEQLSPYEIESITLLKDASATAIYGSRGANGVLLITTKRGQEGPLIVDFNTQIGFQNAKRTPNFLNSYDYARLYNEALTNDGQQSAYSSEELEAYRMGSNPYLYPDVNFYDELLRDASPVSTFNLNFRGGNETVRYFGSLNMLDTKSLFINAGNLSPENSINPSFRRYNFRTNIDLSLTSTLSANLLLGGSVENKGNPANHTTEDIFSLMSVIPPNAFPIFNPDGSYGGNSLYTNPFGDILETGQYTWNSRALQSTFRLTNQLDALVEGLSASMAISFNNYFRNYSEKSREYARYSIVGYTNSNDEYIYNRIGQNTQLAGDEGQSDQWRNFAFQGSANYHRTFDFHTIDALLIYNSENSSVSDEQHPYKFLGVGGRLTYTHRDKYIAEFSFGYNGTENFAQSHRFGFFPAGSIGWVLSNERFLKGKNSINFLKIKASFGLTGNHHIASERFLFDQQYVWASSYYFGPDNTSNGSLYEGRPANTNITWEKAQTFNIGLEATVFNRFSIEIDVFRQNRYDILTNPNQQIPGVFGMNVDEIWLNDGKVKNQGFEISAHYNSSTRYDLQYVLGINLWYARNEILQMSEVVRRFNYQYRTGRAVGQPFGLESTGFYSTEDFDETGNLRPGLPEPTFGSVQPGDVRYKDLNNDGIIDNNDIGPIGNTDYPDLTAGLEFGLRYKGFDLDMFFHAVTGRTIYLSGNNFYAFQNDGKISEIALNRWTSETQESATYPRLSTDGNQNNYRFSSFWQRDGSFIKLRSIEVGYTFQGDFLNRVGLDRARIFLNGTNLFSVDHVKYSDPEILSGYPAFRTFSAGFYFQM